MADNRTDLNGIPDKNKIEREEAELERKNKWLYPVVIIILSLFFIVGFTYGLNSVLSMEGAYPEPVLTQAKTPPPADTEAMLSYLSDVVAMAKTEKPAFSRSADCGITDGQEIALDMEAAGSETLMETISFLSDDFEDFVKNSVFPGATEGDPDPNARDYTVGFDDLLNVPAFSAEDVRTFDCDYIYYKCISCGEESSDPLDACEDCGSDYPYQMMYRDTYTFCVDLNVSDALIQKNFFPRTPDAVKSLLSPVFSGVADVADAEESTRSLQVIFKVNRATDELVALTYRKEISLNLNLAFKDRFAALGSVTVSLPLTESYHYDFSWPGLSLNLHTLSLEPKEKNNLLATLNCDAPTQYNAVWSSSDTSVVEVDDDGYLTAGKADGGKATITASFEFNGKTYSDSCEVFVKYSVESMKLNKRRLTLAPGERETLTATVSPRKATVKTAEWFSTDESIAAVDPKTGEITAVSVGKATVYALSDDGAFKSSCEVTVK